MAYGYYISKIVSILTKHMKLLSLQGALLTAPSPVRAASGVFGLEAYLTALAAAALTLAAAATGVFAASSVLTAPVAEPPPLVPSSPPSGGVGALRSMLGSCLPSLPG